MHATQSYCWIATDYESLCCLYRMCVLLGVGALVVLPVHCPSVPGHSSRCCTCESSPSLCCMCTVLLYQVTLYLDVALVNAITFGRLQKMLDELVSNPQWGLFFSWPLSSYIDAGINLPTYDLVFLVWNITVYGTRKCISILFLLTPMWIMESH